MNDSRTEITLTDKENTFMFDHVCPETTNQVRPPINVLQSDACERHVLSKTLSCGLPVTPLLFSAFHVYIVASVSLSAPVTPCSLLFHML